MRMGQASGSLERGRSWAGGSSVVGMLRSAVGRAVESAGFWGAVLLPFVAVALLAVKPTGWLPLLAGVFGANFVAVFAGHCRGPDC